MREGVDDSDALFAFVSDLRTDEAAMVERVRRRLAEEGADANAAGDDYPSTFPVVSEDGAHAGRRRDDARQPAEAETVENWL